MRLSLQTLSVWLEGRERVKTSNQIPKHGMEYSAKERNVAIEAVVPIVFHSFVGLSFFFLTTFVGLSNLYLCCWFLLFFIVWDVIFTQTFPNYNIFLIILLCFNLKAFNQKKTSNFVKRKVHFITFIIEN